jgi:hypothetical protein
MQSSKWSFIETGANVLIGWVTALIVQMIVFPMFGIHVPFSTNLYMSIVFTVLSIVRGYLLRRFFNGLTIKRMKGALHADSPGI